MANFEKFYPRLKEAEGGYATLPNDAGGCTNHGIAFNFNKEHIGDYNQDGKVDCEDVRLMPISEAKRISKLQYWDKFLADHIQTQEIAEMIFDWGFHVGIYQVMFWVQDILGLPRRSYWTKDVEIKAINSAKQKELYEKLFATRELKYKQGRQDYLVGFLNRLYKFPKTINPINGKKIAIFTLLFLVALAVLLYFYRKETLAFYQKTLQKLKKK